MKKSQNSRNQCFSYYFCLLIEGYGSVSLTNESAFGSGRPKNICIRKTEKKIMLTLRRSSLRDLTRLLRSATTAVERFSAITSCWPASKDSISMSCSDGEQFENQCKKKTEYECWLTKMQIYFFSWGFTVLEDAALAASALAVCQTL